MMKQKNVMQIPDVYKPSEFAKIAGVSVNTLQRWDREGRLTAYRTPAGRRYYTRKHVIEIKHSTPQEEEAWMKDEATLNLWLSPYPLKWLENGGVSRASRIGDDVAYAVSEDHNTVASTWFSFYAMFAGRNVTLAPVTFASRTEIHEGVLFRVETPKIDEKLLGVHLLTPHIVETGQVPSFQAGEKAETKNQKLMEKIFSTFVNDSGRQFTEFVWMEPGMATICLDNEFRKKSAMGTIAAFDKYLEDSPDVRALISMM